VKEVPHSQFVVCPVHHHQHAITEPCPFCVIAGDPVADNDDDGDNEPLIMTEKHLEYMNSIGFRHSTVEGVQRYFDELPLRKKNVFLVDFNNWLAGQQKA
jgi:hypothetical protein